MSAGSTISRLGRYQLSRVLGQGAMGVVYEGLDPLLNRQVAVKTILRSALVDADTLADSSARFVREAQAIARLNHPHIVTVFDFGEEGDVAYFVMEFIRGRELKSYFDEGEFFGLAESLRIVGELLEALEFAHQQGVVHRDVKPANVMLDAGRRVKLTDFGVARLADASGERTMAGTMVGTPSYMSPEQIQGLAVGSRTDLFAAGIILYQCLTGAKPFPGPGAWTVQKQIVHDDPLPPSVANPEIDPAFDAIVARALAKDPADRYGSAAEFAAELKALQARLAIAAPPAGGPARQAEASAPPPPAASEATYVEASLVAAPAEAAPAPRAAAEATAVPEAVAAAPGAPPPRPNRLPWLAGAAAVGVAAVYLLLPGKPSPLPVSEPASLPAPTAPTAPTAPAEAKPAAPPAALPPPAPAGESVPPAAQPAPPGAVEAPPKAAKPALAAAPKAAKAEVAAKPRPAAGKGPSSARCDDLLQRFQLGEGLSPDDLMVLQKECRK